ncbi:MAG: ABC transporter ATP-binding protein [Ardenticatenales bacterium]|nr:ABC transporter ATP-binding protein [Ardenticatenales bacterium]
MTPLLDVRDLETRFFTRAGTVHAVNGISFSVNEGETVGMVGESGSGKSVTALSLLRLIPSPPGRITKGEILFGGRDLRNVDLGAMRAIRGHEIAMVFQDPMSAFNPILTIERQLTEGMRVHLGMSAQQARKRALDLLDMVGIAHPEAQLCSYPHQLSGGMRQRVMIAMALSCSPKLLIADEPTTALDVTIQAQIVDLIQRLKRELGMAILWITHDLGVTAALADRLLVMYAGQIVEEGPLRPLYADPRHPYTIGLLQSIPRLDRGRQDKLNPIEGAPPDLVTYPVGCPFTPRCPFAIPQCHTEDPPLMEVGMGQAAACWVRPHGGELLRPQSIQTVEIPSQGS